MSREAISFVKAIKHSHVSVDDETPIAAEVFVLSKDAAVRKERRETLYSMITTIDDAIRQLDVFPSRVFNSKGDMHDIVENTLSYFEPIRDVVKSMAVEIDNVKVMHSAVGIDNTLASVCVTGRI
jgi:hypothetical protein